MHMLFLGLVTHYWLADKILEILKFIPDKIFDFAVFDKGTVLLYP